MQAALPPRAIQTAPPALGCRRLRLPPRRCEPSDSLSLTLLAVTVRAMVPVWTDPEFTAETLAAFPDQMIATVEEARVSRGACCWGAGARRRPGLLQA